MRRITIAGGDSREGPRLGGRPPEGVTDPRMTEDCRYFLTVPICEAPALELSVFINCDFRTLIGSDDLIRDDRVLLLTHAPRPRCESSPWTSQLSEHRLVLGPEADDFIYIEKYDEEVVESRHKLGGRPYTIQEEAEDLEGTREAASLGMRHYLQFDTPEGAEHVSGSWPFGGGMVHLFFRGPLCAAEWACFREH